MCRKMKLAGIDAKVIKLTDVAGDINPAEIKSIMDHGKLIDHVYHRIRDGVLVFVCSTKAKNADLEILVKSLIRKMKEQKKRNIHSVSVFIFNHRDNSDHVPLLSVLV